MDRCPICDNKTSLLDKKSSFSFIKTCPQPKASGLVHPKPCVVTSVTVDLVVSTAVIRFNGVVVSITGNVLTGKETDAVVKKLNDPHGSVPL